jgi:hypothetical protein
MNWSLIMAIFITTSLIPFIAGETVKIYPSHDAYVNDYSPTLPFNTADLRVGHYDYSGSPKGRMRTFVKFNLSSVNIQNVSSAFLDLDPVGGPVGQDFNINLYYVSNDSWTETSLRWNNQPSYSTLIATKLISNGERIKFNVTNFINESDRTLSMVLKSAIEDTDNVYAVFASSEDAEGETYWPYLEVTYSGGISCNTTADTSGDGKISMAELLAYISRWKLGQVTMGSLLQAIGYWKAGAGC